MSRIGKQSIVIPSGIEVKLNANERTINVKGPKGNLNFDWRSEVSVQHDEADKKICCAIAEGTDENRQARALWGFLGLLNGTER